MTKILIIDDEELIRKRLKKILELDDFNVFTAENGKRGLETYIEQKPDIILLDIKMPGMDGIEVLKNIKKQDLNHHSEVIMITGHGGVESAIDAMREGAFAYLQKPIDIDELEIDIQNAIKKLKMHEQLDVHVLALEDRTIELEKTNMKMEGLYRKLRHDYEVAAKVFRNVIRRDDLQLKNVKYMLSSMDIFCGDLAIALPKPNGGLYAFLGDFTGHGLIAAIGAIPVTDIFYAMARVKAPLIDIILAINKKLKETLPTGLFLAACLGELDCENGIFSVWNGGNPDILILDKKNNFKTRISSTNLPLGVVSNEMLNPKLEKLEVETGDRIFMYSDGVVETFNSEGLIYGQERFEKCLLNYAPTSTDTLDVLGKELKNFRGDVEQKDDVTMMEIICTEPEVKKQKADIQSLNKKGWHFSFEIQAETLRSVDSLANLFTKIKDDEVLSSHKENIYLILSELYTNALDYGVLHIDPGLKKSILGFETYFQERFSRLNHISDGWIKMAIAYEPEHGPDESGIFMVRMEDSGEGFDYMKKLPKLEENPAFGGRGIPLLKSLCKNVRYCGKGNCVEIEYEVD
ncbi:chemotaxis protein CheY [Candidatus Magnetomorum sp. HK-1]|nr:chemotaxis protein CheY [Candidatus Magnetomorum sp. HK-1]